MTLREKLDRLPPCIVRIFAKRDGKLVSDRYLMKVTGWGQRRLISTYQRKSWGGIKVEDADKFLAACGRTWTSQRRERWLLQLALSRGGLNGIAEMRHIKRCWRRGEASQIKRHLKRIEQLLKS